MNRQNQNNQFNSTEKTPQKNSPTNFPKNNNSKFREFYLIPARFVLSPSTSIINEFGKIKC